MNDIDLQFRTAVVGGFQKQDVLSYLETSNQEHNQRVSNLQRELEEQRAACSESEKELNELREKLKDLESSRDTLMAQNADQAQKLEQLELAVSAASKEKDEMSSRANQLQARVEELEPVAAQYEAIKERTAGIELEAHGRAQMIEREAKEKAHKLQSDMDAWCDRLTSAYHDVHAEMQSSLARVQENLEQVTAGASHIGDVFNQQENFLVQLRKSVNEITGPKAPQPIPPDET